MKITKIYLVFLFSLSAGNLSLADEAEEVCKKNLDTMVYVRESFECIPVDPCASSDTNIRKKYCVQSVEDIDTDYRGDYYYGYGKEERYGKRCHRTAQNIPWNTKDPEDESLCTNIGLEPGEWAVRFPYGTIKGQSKCSGANGLNMADLGNITDKEYRAQQKKVWTYDETALNIELNEKQFCWCKAKGVYKLMSDNTPKLVFMQNPWVYFPVENKKYCEADCAEECARSIYMAMDDGRNALFFGKQALFKSFGDTDAKISCENNVDDYVYVQEDDMCIPVDVCNSSDKNVRSKYCINSVNDIDINIRGTHARIYSYNDKYKTNKCIANMAGKSADWPASDCEKVGLNRNEWLVRFPYGTVKGKSKCSAYKGTDMGNIAYWNTATKIKTTNENLLDTTSGEKNYCWCKATGLYTLMTDKIPNLPFTQNPWVYIGDKNGSWGASGCDVNCEEACAEEVRKNDYNFRQPIFFGK